jgi:hypothetical protein
LFTTGRVVLDPRPTEPKRRSPKRGRERYRYRGPQRYLSLVFVHNKRCAKEGRDCLQLKGKVLGLTLVHLDLTRRLSIRMAEGNTECISRLSYSSRPKSTLIKLRSQMTFRSIMADLSKDWHARP